MMLHNNDSKRTVTLGAVHDTLERPLQRSRANSWRFTSVNAGVYV
eukprot:CAMPEP_0174366998 /NCGR_PEP_ID=MMETSP0811_2-20130205/83379_1 /TAXON_ID=73025 ORGANISM="Eutreptiella gymnastica-like, Strain CCMP1594" /NCGR_SAMPLE_ID=MMETSP0811_2 /ASSEMBLY_ACC=CAM_ASM_000667 /LENGTH=44 /DNA_ID= /DNA_START= /DNA_END= /DNA_ORIENTATION=